MGSWKLRKTLPGEKYITSQLLSTRLRAKILQNSQMWSPGQKKTNGTQGMGYTSSLAPHYNPEHDLSESYEGILLHVRGGQMGILPQID